MTPYKRFLRVLLRKLYMSDNEFIPCSSRMNKVEQYILWTALSHKYVDINDYQCFVLTEKGRKFISK